MSSRNMMIPCGIPQGTCLDPVLFLAVVSSMFCNLDIRSLTLVGIADAFFYVLTIQEILVNLTREASAIKMPHYP